MTRGRSTLAVLVLLAVCALHAGCGKYGPPRRAGQAPAPAVAAGHAAACENPEHDHDEPESAEQTP